MNVTLFSGRAEAVHSEDTRRLVWDTMDKGTESLLGSISKVASGTVTVIAATLRRKVGEC